MPRLNQSHRLDSRRIRTQLPVRAEPYWHRLAKGCYLGYRRNPSGGTWIARYRTPTNRQHYHALGGADDDFPADGLITFSFDQAQVRAREWCQRAAAMAILGRPQMVYTVANCLDDYLAWAKEHRKSGAHLAVYIRAFIKPRLGHLDTATLTTPILRQWHQDLAKEPPRLRARAGAEPTYRAEDPDPEEARRKRQLRANRMLVILRAALNRAWRDGLVTAHRDEWMRVEPFRGVERQRSKYLPQEQARRLLNACEPELRALVHLALLTGARYGELCAFNVGDFNGDSGTLLVRTSKSGKARHIVLNDEGIALVRRLAAGRAAREPLLSVEGQRWCRDIHFRRYKQAVRHAGLDPDFTFHELRHTWASLAVMNGLPLMVVAQNLGHRDTRMVELHYGHLANTYVAQQLRDKAPRFGLIAETTVVPFAAACGTPMWPPAE